MLCMDNQAAILCPFTLPPPLNCRPVRMSASRSAPLSRRHPCAALVASVKTMASILSRAPHVCWPFPAEPWRTLTPSELVVRIGTQCTAGNSYHTGTVSRSFAGHVAAYITKLHSVSPCRISHSSCRGSPVCLFKASRHYPVISFPYHNRTSHG